jgi:hypothetical protein
LFPNTLLLLKISIGCDKSQKISLLIEESEVFFQESLDSIILAKAAIVSNKKGEAKIIASNFW